MSRRRRLSKGAKTATVLPPTHPHHSEWDKANRLSPFNIALKAACRGTHSARPDGGSLRLGFVCRRRLVSWCQRKRLVNQSHRHPLFPSTTTESGDRRSLWLQDRLFWVRSGLLPECRTRRMGRERQSSTQGWNIVRHTHDMRARDMTPAARHEAEQKSTPPPPSQSPVPGLVVSRKRRRCKQASGGSWE